MKRKQKTGVRTGSSVLMASLCGLCISTSAHEVRYQVAPVSAMSVRLLYANGEPFSYERYELYANDGQRPSQTGRTDAEGRLLFLPGESKSLHLRAFSADGHGVDVHLKTESGATPLTPVPATDRGTRVMLGLVLILAVFGAMQLFLKKKKTA